MRRWSRKSKYSISPNHAGRKQWRRTRIGLSVVAAAAAVLAAIGAVPAIADDGDEPCVWASWGTLSVSRSPSVLGEPVALRWSVSTWCSIITISGPGFNGGEGVGSSGVRELAPDAGGTWVLSVWSRDTGFGRQLAVLSPSVQSQGGISGPGSFVAAGMDLGEATAFFPDPFGLTGAGVRANFFGDFIPGNGRASALTPRRGLAAGNNADGRLVVSDFDRFGQLTVRWAQGQLGTLTGQLFLDGTVASTALARHENGRLALFGVTPTGRIQVRSQNVANGDTSWSGWSPLPGELREIAAETNANGRIELFGVDRNGAIWHATQTAPNSNAWSAWAQFPGALFSITAARNQDGRLEVFGANTAGQVFHQKQTEPGGPNWTGWSQIANAPVVRVAAEPALDGRIVVFGVTSGGNLVFDWQPTVNAASLTGQGWRSLTSTTTAQTRFGAVSAPSLFSVTGGDGGPFLNWSDESTNEEGFRVFRQRPNGTWTVWTDLQSAIPGEIAGMRRTAVFPHSCYAVGAYNSDSMRVGPAVCVA